MVRTKLTDIFKDSVGVEDAVAAETNTPINHSFEAISAGAGGVPSARFEVVVVRERRRRCSAQEKLEFMKLTYMPSNCVSSIARQYNISPSLLFKWRQLYKDSDLTAITSGSEIASAREIAQLKDEIKRLHPLVERQATDLALYKEATEVMREKIWITR